MTDRTDPRASIIAGPHYDRWLVPPAALAVHLSIGMAYGFSVFWLRCRARSAWPRRSPVPT